MPPSHSQRSESQPAPKRLIQPALGRAELVSTCYARWATIFSACMRYWLSCILGILGCGSDAPEGETHFDSSKCAVPLDARPPECPVVTSIYGFDESGCVRDQYERLGCGRPDLPVSDATFGAIGPDGRCWILGSSLIPYGFAKSEDCGDRLFSAQSCPG